MAKKHGARSRVSRKCDPASFEDALPAKQWDVDPTVARAMFQLAAKRLEVKPDMLEWWVLDALGRKPKSPGEVLRVVSCFEKGEQPCW